MTYRRAASIDEALRGILAHLGGRTYAVDEPAGMVAARIVDILHGGDGGERLPEFLALVPLGRWLAEMVAVFGGQPVSESTQEVAAQLLGVLRGGDGVVESRTDRRYPGDILNDVLETLRSPEFRAWRESRQVL
ncbi:MAG TPA: hypothetical protein VNN10_03430 [Dehalococcoidia bacterium]|nr:hypothetical protein [Dehalococcoidia bacterium]